jgi:hypothetical protein
MTRSTTDRRHPMDIRTSEVDHRLDELRRCSDSIRAERFAPGGDGRWTELRLALGRRLVAVGTALQAGAASATRTPTH